jgi:hypothetical protein
MPIGGVLRAKHWYSLALSQSSSRHPFAAGVVVAHLQDAVESLAYTVAAQLGANLRPNANFHDYWDEVAKLGGKRLPYKSEMSELNHARVGFKHKGTLPAERDAERFVRAAHRGLSEILCLSRLH